MNVGELENKKNYGGMRTPIIWERGPEIRMALDLCVCVYVSISIETA